MTEDDLMLMEDVVARVRISRAHIHRLITAGDFPAPLKITPRKNGWFRRDIESWLASRRKGLNTRGEAA